MFHASGNETALPITLTKKYLTDNGNMVNSAVASGHIISEYGYDILNRYLHGLCNSIVSRCI